MPEKASASSAPASRWRELPKCAAWSRHSSTIGHLLSRSLSPALSRPSSIELGVLVDRVESYLDADRREIQHRVALDDFVGPTVAGARVKIDTALVLLDDRVLSDRRCREVVEFLAAPILALGARRNHLDNQDRIGKMIVPVAYGAAGHRNIRVANGVVGDDLHIAAERTATRAAQGLPQRKGKVHRDRDMG